MSRVVAMRRGLVALCALYFVLWACGPALSGPPPVPMAEGRVHEVGLAPHYGVAYVPDGIDWMPGKPTLLSRCAEAFTPTCAGPSGQLWYRHRAEHFDIGAVAFGGSPTLGGAGLLFRYRFHETPRLVTALQLDGGFLWAAVGAPVAFALSDRTWLSVHPQVALKAWSPLRLATGIHHTTPDGLMFGFEGGVGTDPGLFAQQTVLDFDMGAQIGVQFQ